MEQALKRESTSKMSVSLTACERWSTTPIVQQGRPWTFLPGNRSCSGIDQALKAEQKKYMSNPEQGEIVLNKDRPQAWE